MAEYVNVYNEGHGSRKVPVIQGATKITASAYNASGNVSYLFDDFATGKLLASLAAGSTATRVGLTVTVTATAHGIPSGTFSGARFFFPGCPSLAADWYYNFTYVSANSFTFTLPVGMAGADFAGESVNGGAAYVTQTRIGSTTFPANFFKSGMRVTTVVYRECDTTAASKSIFPYVDSDKTGKGTGTTASTGTLRSTFWLDGTKLRSTPFHSDSDTPAVSQALTKNYAVPWVLALEGIVSAAGAYLYVPAQPYMLIS